MAATTATATATTAPARDGPKAKREIYTHEASWLLYGMTWSNRADQPYRLALGSFLEAYTNKIEIVQLDEDANEFVSRAVFDHPYPTTKLMFLPSEATHYADLLATTGDYLRLWGVGEDGRVTEKALLNNNKNSEFCAPIASFDWNRDDPNILGTASIDTTCTIWDVEKSMARTQLIAHDKEVYDIAFAKGTDVFASLGADGSMRMFDLRSLDHSTIIYESPQFTPLLRLAWNKQDPNFISAIMMDSPNTIILDIRVPSLPVETLSGHNAAVNAMAWAPHSSCHICTAGDDSQALIWDLKAMPKPVEDPILAYRADKEINQLNWSALQPDWVAITYDKKLQILRV